MKIALLIDGDFSREVVEASFDEIVSNNCLLALSTTSIDNVPHINTAFFFVDSDRLVFLSDPTTTHVSNLRANPKAAVAIADAAHGQSYAWQPSVAQ